MDTLKGISALVTGGCGFIGVNLVAALLNKGAVVSVLDLPSADWERLPLGVKRVEADILNPSALTAVFDDIELVYHLAARTDLDGRKLPDYRVNFEGTKNLITEIAQRKKVRRLVFYSTQLVVGLFNQTRFLDEDEPYRTKTIYGQSKIEAEKIIKEYCNKDKIAFTIIRPTSVYGPWGGPPYKDFFRTIKTHRYLHVGKAANLVSLVYVKNLVDLTILASLSRQAENETYFANDFHPYTMRQIVDAVGAYYNIKIPTAPSAFITAAAYALGPLKLLGFNVPIYPFRLTNIKASYCYDIQKSIRLGYDPQYDLTQGIKETLDWYEAHGQL